MNQNTCKTCKWWQWDREDTVGSIMVNHVPMIQFKCGNVHVKDRDLEGMVDGEGYSGVFTGPDFGCIHYEETQEQLPQDHPGYARQQKKIELRSQVIVHPAYAHLLKDK